MAGAIYKYMHLWTSSLSSFFVEMEGFCCRLVVNVVLIYFLLCLLGVCARLHIMCWPQVDGQKYSGQGRSKKMARLIAAESALRNFIQLKDGAVLIKTHLQDASLDFTSDELLNENGAAGAAGGAAAANGNE